MSIPTGYKGQVSFYWHTKFGFTSCVNHKSGEAVGALGDDWILISDPVDIEVAFRDVRAEQIAALEKQIEKERAESQFRINQMLGKIQELQAIEARSDV